MKLNYILIICFCPIIIVAQTAFTASIAPDLSAYGETSNYPGEGEYQIFLDTNDGVFDKPIIFVDGFDPGDTRDIANVYDLLNFEGASGTQNLADLVRAEGFDLVFLNFPVYTRAADDAVVDGGADFMERNAMLLVDLLGIVNTTKVGSEQNVIIGPSMGGIISRYALNYMEANSLDADTRLWISFDAPHHGANIPIGLQHQLNYLAFNALNPIAEIQPLITNTLSSNASKQLLVDHFEAHITDADGVTFNPALTLPTPNAFRTLFETNINSFNATGFPENVRKVSIVNGSGIGNPYFAIGNSGTVVTSGFEALNTTLPISTPLGNIDVELSINLTPEANTTAQVSRFFAPSLLPPIIPDIESVANSEATTFAGVDAAPGGLFELSGLTGDLTGNPLAEDFISALQIDKFNFIPTVSALALEIANDDIDWFHDINLSANRATTNNTPFDNTYLPDDNESHVQLTQGNVNFALAEILNPVLTTSDFETVTFKLEKNPVDNEIVLLSNTNLNGKVRIMDLTGKVVYDHTKKLETKTPITLNLNSGIYVLDVLIQNNSSFKTKFIVN